MIFNKLYFFIIISLLFFSCGEEDIRSNSANNLTDKECAYERADEVVWVENGSKWLYGGEADSMHFDISNWTLNECQLNFGLGREVYKALIKTSYTTITDISGITPSAKCLVLFDEGQVRVYPYHILSYHEVVNEHIQGIPIAVGYCELADLAVVYERTICDTELTFAITGYTYADPFVYNNIQSFVMWDRETESLWWPLIDQGVSGKFRGTEMKYYDESKWTTLSWQEIVDQHPEAKVLNLDQADINAKNYKVDPSTIDCF